MSLFSAIKNFFSSLLSRDRGGGERGELLPSPAPKPESPRHAGKMSTRGRIILKQLEGWREEPYKDAAGFLTVGVGHLLSAEEEENKGVHVGDRFFSFPLSAFAVEMLLDQDLRSREKAVREEVKEALNQGQFDALVSFVFNVGRKAFETSSLLRLLNKGERLIIPHQFRKWVWAGGRKLDGLKKRREAEIAMWFSNYTEALAIATGEASINWNDLKKGKGRE